MNQIQKTAIKRLRIAGVAQAEIVRKLDLSKSTVTSYLSRNQIEPLIKEVKGHCAICHKPLPTGTRSDCKTCSASCRYTLWKLKQVEKLGALPVCPICGERFVPRRGQRYCSHGCFLKSRQKAVHHD